MKKPKTDSDSLPAEASAKKKDSEGDSPMTNTVGEHAAAGASVSPMAQKHEAALAEHADAPQTEKRDDVVNLVSPQASPSKSKPCEESSGRSAEATTQPTQSVAKRQCVRYNETQTRKLEALFALGKDKFDFAAVCIP